MNFKNCVFDGYPPAGFDSWFAWVESPLKEGVTIRASATDEIETLRQRVKELEAELVGEEQRIADLMGDINRQGHELATLKQAQGEPVGIYHNQPALMRHGIEWFINGPLADGTKIYTSAPTIPEGWQLVPVEPTDVMLGAGLRHIRGMASMPNAYAAMLSAAPKPGDPA